MFTRLAGIAAARTGKLGNLTEERIIKSYSEGIKNITESCEFLYF
jgi:hypothetical protein